MFTESGRDVPLTVLLFRAERAVMEHLLTLLAPRFPGLTTAHLAFFGALDCGVTHASAAAARLGISRQAVSRTVRELVGLGLLEPVDAVPQGAKAEIRMTARGEALALAGRACLAELEAGLGPLGAEPLRVALSALSDLRSGS